MVNIVTDFGADPTGTTDSATAIQNALNSGPGAIYCPPGIYLIGSTLQMSTNCQKLYTDARSSATFVSQASGATIEITNSAVYVEIKNLLLTRTTTATVGQNAIQTTSSPLSNFMRFDNLVINNHYNAFRLGYTGYSYIQNCYLQQNYSDAIYMEATSSMGAMQWTIRDTLIELNDGWGILVQGANSGSNSIPMGEWNNVSTFANKSGGVCVQGTPNTAFQGVRIMGGFFGQDGGMEIQLDTYGGFTHKIVGVYCELAGTLACGRNQSSSPSNGYGLYITANNSETLVSGSVFRGNSLSGIFTTGANVVISGCESTYNGAAAVSGNRNGIYIAGGRAIVCDGNYTNNQYGLVINTDNHIICNNNLAPNSAGTYWSSVAFTKTKFDNNLLVV